LKFLLTKREDSAECPSILINAGSHGGNFGKNAHSTGNFTLTSIKIYDEIVDLVAELIQDKTLRLNPEDAKRKIYIHKLDSSTPCIYSPFADHIIDVQCCGAFEKVPVKNLVPPGMNQSTEVDLMFLDRIE
jgi:hypothetical protein